MSEELQFCRTLLCEEEGLYPVYANASLSPELAGDYGRIIAAQNLGKSLQTIAGEAVLCRIALTTDEDDRVRKECVQQLLNNESQFLEVVLFGLLFDDDEEMRLAAIEGLVLMKSGNIQLAASIVANDKSRKVRKLIEVATTGMSIDLYHLDPPASPYRPKGAT